MDVGTVVSNMKEFINKHIEYLSRYFAMKSRATSTYYTIVTIPFA